MSQRRIRIAVGSVLSVCLFASCFTGCTTTTKSSADMHDSRPDFTVAALRDVISHSSSDDTTYARENEVGAAVVKGKKTIRFSSPVGNDGAYTVAFMCRHSDTEYGFGLQNDKGGYHHLLMQESCSGDDRIVQFVSLAASKFPEGTSLAVDAEGQAELAVIIYTTNTPRSD